MTGGHLVSRGMCRQTAHRVGRRGFSLLFLGLLDVLYAQSLWSQPPEVRNTPGPQFVGTVVPLSTWAVIWAMVGLVCLVQAFMRMDRVAFAAASALMLTWGLLNVAGWSVGEVPRGWVAGSIWVAFGAWITIIATWPETTEVIRRVNGVADAVVGADSGGRITTWNAAAAAVFGWRASEIIGEPLTTLIPEELRDRHRAGFERAVRDRHSDLVGRVLPLTAVRRDGTRIPVELTISVWTAPDGDVSFTGLVRDMGAVRAKGRGR